MNVSLSIRGQSCSNAACALLGTIDAGNVVVHSQKEKRLKCTACGGTWVTRKHNASYRLRASAHQLDAVATMLKEGRSVRDIAKEIGASPSTIQRWKQRLVHSSLS